MAERLDIGTERVLAVFAHPDDPEVSCGGALRRWADAGGETRLVICNRGEKGTHDPATDPKKLARRRAREVADAAAVLGVSSWELLDVPDGELENTSELRGRVVGEVRRFRPDIVICPDPTAIFFGDSYVNHRDHRAAGWATLDACAPAAASPLYFPDEGPVHRVTTILLSGTLEPDAYVDISASVAAKIEAVACHASQVDDPQVIDQLIRQRAAEEGRAIGAEAAEGFRCLRLD